MSSVTVRRVDETETERFLRAGWSQRHVLEVLVGVALKVMSNYTNHLADTPLDDAMKTAEWAPPSAAKA